jgi:hypothetical protein
LPPMLLPLLMLMLMDLLPLAPEDEPMVELASPDAACRGSVLRWSQHSTADQISSEHSSAHVDGLAAHSTRGGTHGGVCVTTQTRQHNSKGFEQATGGCGGVGPGLGGGGVKQRQLNPPF